MVSFTTMNGVNVKIEIVLDSYRGTPSLLLCGTVRTEESVAVEPALSVSVPLNSGSRSYRTMGSALLNVLYQIDAELAKRAWEGVVVKGA